MPLVSVTVPTYNHADFVLASLDSILAQDYPNIEVIVADDGSDDEAPALLERYAKAHPGVIRLLLAPRREGITHNVNKAWRACRGKYVALMAGDDLMLPGKISKQVELLEAKPDCAICYHDLDVFDSENDRHLYRWNASKQNPPYEDGAARLISHGTFIGACSVMLRRSAAPETGFDERIAVASDWLFLIETAIRGGVLRFIPEVLGRHRRHARNVTRERPGFNELFDTLTIVEEKYPSYKRAVRKGRGRLYYARAVDSLCTGNGRAARQLLYLSVMHSWLSWKSAVRWLQSFAV